MKSHIWLKVLNPTNSEYFIIMENNSNKKL